MKTLWIARDKNGYLYLYNNKPIRNEKFDLFEINDDESECENIILYYDSIELDSELFPEVTWENSPQQVELVFSKINSKNDIIMKVIGILLILILMIIPINLVITLIKLLTN